MASSIDEPHVPGWEVADGALRRSVRFADFSEAFAFMVRVAMAAEALGHHPDWSNSWDRVDLAITSHEHGGITDRCVELAARVNDVLGEDRP